MNSVVRFSDLTKDALSLLHNALGLPNKFVCQNRTIYTGIEGLCIVVRRLAYPSRLEYLQHLFGRSKVELSYIFNEVLDCIYTLHCHLLTALDTPWLSHQNLDSFAAAVNERG